MHCCHLIIRLQWRFAGNPNTTFLLFVWFFFLVCALCFLKFPGFFAAPGACGSSQVRDQIRTTAATQATAVTMLDP